MEVRLLDKDKENNKLSFILKGASPSFANALRRTIIEDVPTMAIEDVDISQNSSILYDEMIAHRLGMIPLKTDLKSYNVPEECKCEGKGCARCQLKLTLSTKDAGTVYASELKSKDPAVKPIFPQTPIVKLLKGQKLELEATAVLGKGKVHSKWIPAHVYYSYNAKITVNNNQELLNKFANKYPPQVYGEGGIDRNKINTPNLIDACDGICDDLVKIERKKDEFVFYIESWGQLDPKKIIAEALRILTNEFDALSESIKKA